jgi:hypothetical protein
MAAIAILSHALDRILWQRQDGNGYNCPYLIGQMALELIRRGHQVEIVHGLEAKNPQADLAILHVDLTCVPTDYLDFAASFRRCLNAQVSDIRKTTVSMAQLSRHPDWQGPVMVKSNLNCNGSPEVLKNDRLAKVGEVPVHAGACEFNDYLIYETVDAIPDSIRQRPEIAIDAFMPEREDGLYAIRHWVFCGDRGHCSRHVSPEPVIKGGNIIRRDIVEVPAALRTIRSQMGFNYGKFDYVMHGGECYLLDANKTPGSPPSLALADGRYIATMSDGFESFLE